MCEIKKIRRLKKRQEKIIEKFYSQDPLSVLPQSHVSQTGLTHSDITEKIERISNCASIIELRDSFVQVNDTFEQVMKVAAANFCKQHTVCPVCADRMQNRRRARFNDSIKKQAEMVEAGKRFVYMVTYTVKDGGSLSERLKHLNESKRDFRKMGQRRIGGARSIGEAGKIKAAIATTEIKKGSGSEQWHVHSHDLVFTDEPIDYIVYDQKIKKQLEKKYGERIPGDKLKTAALHLARFGGSDVPASKVSLEWLRATDGDSINIYFEPVRHVPRDRIEYKHGRYIKKSIPARKKRLLSKMSFANSIAYQAKEVLKYPVKPWECTITDSLTILNDTYNKRMVGTYGEFRNLSGDDYNDEPAESESFVMIWKAGNYGDAIPGNVRDLGGEEETETRSKAGKLLGEYRRARRLLIEKRDTVGSDLSFMLDDLKAQFRKQFSAIWSLYRYSKKNAEAIKNANCDKYSTVLALQGIYSPGSDGRDIYSAAFT